MLLPPPYWVRKPKHDTWSLLVLYSSASFERSSSFETFARLGWRTSLEGRSGGQSRIYDRDSLDETAQREGFK